MFVYFAVGSQSTSTNIYTIQRSNMTSIKQIFRDKIYGSLGDIAYCTTLFSNTTEYTHKGKYTTQQHHLLVMSTTAAMTAKHI